MYRNFLKNLKILIATLVTFFILHEWTNDLVTTVVVTNLVACLLGVICYEMQLNAMRRIAFIERPLKDKVKTFLYLFVMWCIISMIGIYTVINILSVFFGVDANNVFVYVGIYSVIAGIGIEVDHYLLKRAFFILK